MDSILNEMIKHGRYFLLPSLEKIFNDILNSGKFPTEWNIGVIKPIYKKKGDRRSPANYRGITFTSCLGKLFTSILQSRLNKYIEIHKILNPEQFGFRPNARTTDSLFILQQLLHKYTKQHEKLYVGFIDYEKAFDSVWQSGMIHKLQKEGIQGKFLKVIKSMYLLWFNFILGLIFISLSFKLIIIYYHAQKQRKIKIKPRIKLNHNIFIN